MPKKIYPMLIGGERVPNEKTCDVVNPATGQVIGAVSELDSRLTQKALKAAAKGFETWSATTPAKRREVILR
jgi:acyl-CoA reductase-like NAD-dependent aldehyde dehydrogenase